MDFVSYSNTALANLIAVVCILLAYKLIPVVTDNKAILADIKRLFVKAKKGKVTITQVSQQLFAMYPVLIHDQTTRSDFYKLLLLSEGMKLNELGLISQQATDAMIVLGEIENTSEEWNRAIGIIEDEIKDKWGTQGEERYDDANAATAWWSLDIALGRLKKTEPNLA